MGSELKRRSNRKVIRYTAVGVGIFLVILTIGLNYVYGILEQRLIDQGVLEETVKGIMRMLYGVSGGGFVIAVILFGILCYFQVKSNRALEKIVFVDSITGGSTYEKFKMDVEDYLKKNTRQTYAVLSIDIDKSKYIEEIFGNEEYIKAINYVWNVLSEETAENEFCCHKDADHFYALFQYKDENRIKQRIEEMYDDIREKIEQGEIYYDLKISVGVYILNNRKHGVERILSRSDVARKTIKGQHDRLYAFYTEEMKKSQVKNKEIEDRMEKALEKGEFYVCYQPKFSTQEKKVVGAEALVRWRMNGENIIPPSEFIPLFESNGFIKELDKYVFEQVCKDVSGWLDKGLDVKPVSVNLSQMQLYNTNFIKEYAEILERYDLDSKYVQLELTETALFDNPVVLAKIINQLHNMGIEILMDDFGKGYSSLNMLKNVEVDTVKIDKSFVDDIGNNKKVERIIATIISLVRSLNMHVVAEGVENEMQYKFLNLVECDEIQGYYFSKPIVVSEYEELLKKNTNK